MYGLSSAITPTRTHACTHADIYTYTCTHTHTDTLTHLHTISGEKYQQHSWCRWQRAGLLPRVRAEQCSHRERRVPGRVQPGVHDARKIAQREHARETTAGSYASLTWQTNSAFCPLRFKFFPLFQMHENGGLSLLAVDEVQLSP